MAARVGTEDWLPTPRFPRHQRAKVRAIDDASISGSKINLTAKVVDRLRLPTADGSIAILKRLKAATWSRLAGWVLDESAAFRQIPICPDDRRHAIVAAPLTKRVGYFIVVGHPSGMTSGVYNFNRRSEVIGDWLGEMGW